MKSAPAFPWGWAPVAVVGVTVVALVFGVYSATKAARLSPIEALRHESRTRDATFPVSRRSDPGRQRHL